MTNREANVWNVIVIVMFIVGMVAGVVLGTHLQRGRETCVSVVVEDGYEAVRRDDGLAWLDEDLVLVGWGRVEDGPVFAENNDECFEQQVGPDK